MRAQIPRLTRTNLLVRRLRSAKLREADQSRVSGKGAGPGVPVDVRYPSVGSLAGGSGRGAVAGAARGEPDDFGVDRDLSDGVAGAVVLLARTGAERPG